MDFKPANIIATVTGALALIGAVIAFDARYAKEDQVVQSIVDIKDDIITEMRREVVKNRSVMIDNMQREADDIEYQMMQLESQSKPVPRFMSDKYKQITRQIETLKNEKTD